MQKILDKYKKSNKAISITLIIALFLIALFRESGSEQGSSIEFLMDLFIILLSTKVFGIFSKKVQMPAVVGALLAGLIFGPACLNKIHETDFLSKISELGVIVIMFTAGLEVEIKELKKCGKASFIIALLGVITPLVGGFLLTSIINNSGSIFNLSSSQLLENIFMGVILTATSVSITVEVLKELGKINTKVGNTIIAAALIDDILGIIALTLVTSLADPTVNVLLVLGKIIAFFIFVGIVGIIANKLFMSWMEKSEKGLRRHIILSFCLCLALSYIAEEWFGVADITGAFIAGVILSNVSKEIYLNKRFEILSYMLLTPVFFASIGLKVQLTSITPAMLIFTAGLLFVAFASKIVGCYLAGRMNKFNKKDSLRIGIGMMARGEVALIIANKGSALGLMNETYFTPLIIMVIVAAVSTPILLKLVFKSKKEQVSN